MSSLLDELIGAFVDTAPAKAANPAKNEHPCGSAPDPMPANGLRKSAKTGTLSPGLNQNSQVFASDSQAQKGPRSQEICGSSQDSQDSQGYLSQSEPDTLTRFEARRARLMRWGYPEDEADRIAERLTQRDKDEDPRRLCLECSNLGDRGRCLAAARGHIHGAARHLEPVLDMLHRCEAFGLRKGMK